MKNSKIFILEDEIIIIEDLKSILTKLGYQISGYAYSGEGIYEMIKDTMPDLILMDIMLKGKIDGIEIAENLKKHFDIPIIYMTAYADDNTLRRAKITEPLGYILKPYDERNLYATIEMALYKHSANIEIKRKHRILQLLTDFNEKISSLSSSGIIKNSMMFIREKFDIDHISITLKEKDEENKSNYKFIYHSIPESEAGSVNPVTKMNNDVMEKLRPLYVPNIEETDDSRLSAEGLKSVFSVPLSSGNACIGVLNASSKKTDGISDIDRKLILMLSTRLALSIHNSMIFDDLSRSEDRFRTFTNFLPQLIAEVKFDGKLVFVNNSAFRVFGYTMEDFEKGMYVHNLVIPEDAERIQENIRKLANGENVTAKEYVARRKDNTLIPVIIHTNIIYRNNSPIGILALVVDISEQKKIEQSLAKEKELLSVTLRSIDDGVITTDTQGNIILINKMAELLTGWSLTDAIGKNISGILNITYEKDHVTQTYPLSEIIKTGISINSDEIIILYSKDGSEKSIEIKTNLLRDSDNKNIGSVVVFHDITEKNKMQEELIKIKKLESLGVLAGGIAHDFNNLLTAILGNITLAKIHTDTDNKVYEILLEAEKATLRSRDLTQQLLTFSKGGVPVKKVGQISDLFIESANFMLRGSNIKCNFNFQEDLWAIEMDIGQINQVINNLILNACQSMKGSGIININGNNIILNEDIPIPLKKGKYIKIDIQDFGIGISKENMQKIFDPYFTTKEKGTGLGLAITYSIIKKHNGYIEVNSRINEGTTFSIYLPATDQAIQSGQMETSHFPRQKGRILLMDDEKLIREVGYKMLTHLGYEVSLSESGEELIELYKKSLHDKPFDVVIMDLTVPGGMGGKEIIRKLLEINPEIKAIVSSGYSTDPVMANFRDYGFKAVMIKPYKMENMIDILNSVLSD